MEKTYKLWNNLLGLLSFIGASIVYLLTIEPTVSLWDCGEFIATAGKLEVGHPPGAPLFLLLGRFFALFASSPDQIAACINAMSALASGATIMFLFWSITHLAKKFYSDNKELSLSTIIVVLCAGLVGAGAYLKSPKTLADGLMVSMNKNDPAIRAKLLKEIPHM